MNEIQKVISKSVPKVSVIVPVYGVEQYIERCVRSLFEQTLDDVEYLFIDDCTPDKSMEILRSVLEEYPPRMEQVVIHRMEQNSGQAKVREWGMKNAKGVFVIHCDSDDWIDKDMINNLYQKALSTQADIVIGDYSISDGVKTTRIKGCEHTEKKQLIKDLCSTRIAWSVCNKLFRLSLLKNDIVFPKDNMGEDMAITLQAVLKADNIAYEPTAMYYYFKNPSSITHLTSLSSIEEKFNQYKRNAEIVFRTFDKCDIYKEYSKYLDIIKWNVKNHLLNLVHRDNYFKLWYDTYSEINVRILFNRNIKYEDKVKYVLTLFHLYPQKKNRV